MKSIRSWFTTEDRASDVAVDYTNLLLDQALAAARGIDGIKSNAAYQGSLTLIGSSAGVASLSGQHSDALQGHLSTIARSMVDTGQSDWLVNIGSTGGVDLLPCSVSRVVGGPDPRTWLYELTLQGPSAMATVQRSGESILSFRLRTQARSPWQGRPAIDSTGTGQLLCQLEAQMALEAKVAPARVIVGGAVGGQSEDISAIVRAGGVVGLLQAIGTSSVNDPSGLKAGIVRNEVSTAGVTLHEKLSTLICGAMGVPSDLVLGGSSESGSRESFRRLASTTITNILTTVSTEWQLKMGTALEWDLNQLRSSDEVSRARATGSRANAVQRLVQSGVDLPQALAIAGID